MQNLEAFLKPNKITVENRKIPVSKNFIDGQGDPIEWEIRALTSDEESEIKGKCYADKTLKNGATTRVFLSEKYQMKIAAAAVVYPDLRTADLQDSYGVKTPDALLGKMLLPGERDELITQVFDMNGYDNDINTEVEEAKN